MVGFPFFKQRDQKDCGATCLRMISKYYGKVYSMQYLRNKTYTGHNGTSFLHISSGAESIGYRTIPAKMSFQELSKAFSSPCIVHWKQNHFVVVYKIKSGKIFVADPALGKVEYDRETFVKGWSIKATSDQPVGGVLFIEPTPNLLEEEEEKSIGFSFFLSYFKRYKSYYVRIVFGMLAISMITFMLPFLTQAVVDIGIGNQNISFINLMLIAQLTLSLSTTLISFIQSWIFLHVGVRIGISIAIDYLAKLLRLKLPYLETKMIGDLMQRMGDNSRIQGFISSTTLGTIFSFINLIVFSIVMASYNAKILLIFLTGSGIYSFWVFLFVNKRKEYDRKRFEQNSASQTAIIQMFNGLKEIKLHNYEKQKRWEWERIQVKTYKLSMKQMLLGQYQQAGAFMIEQSKNIFISYTVANSVISGEITLGMMMSTQFILGQMGAPIQKLIGFINSYQDAKISLERIGEIHNQETEISSDQGTIKYYAPEGKRSIYFNNVTFDYDGAAFKPALKDATIEIPEGKFTAIVGGSGSGKTTLLKLLVKFYDIKKGAISVGDIKLSKISPDVWRDQCGIVWQEGFLFSESIERNIALSEEDISIDRLQWAARMANIQEFIESLPLGYSTKIGENGLTISQGQKQRLLIARALYKEPHFYFFDEATSALDADNEKVIMNNILTNLSNRTVIFISHRLSTIKNADKIIVLKDGAVAEEGIHEDLIQKKGVYFNLVENQLC